MALRTFRHNPSLGGFGGEASKVVDSSNLTSTVGADAFCQIIKELVDNAVDACRSTNHQAQKHSNNKNQAGRAASNKSNSTIRRVRINLDPATEEDGTEVLRVIVTDNGCGMKDIQSCVDPFQTSKGHNATQNGRESDDQKTSGRYGIGLTLCLLHAQRLVPNTKASITSATPEQTNWTVMSCVVDTDADSVRCFPQPRRPKTTGDESGTSVSLLVPGGSTAVLAWPRLAEYFARFQLSSGLNCRLEVLAPSLSRVPLHVQPIEESRIILGTRRQKKAVEAEAEAKKTPIKQRAEWKDILDDGEPKEREEANVVTPRDAISPNEKVEADPAMDRILCAAQQFLECPVQASNIAHAPVPIRLEGVKPSEAPTLEATMIIYGNQDSESPDPIDEGQPRNDFTNSARNDTEVVPMVLIRMVNQIPLLDSEEGVACGLVQGVVTQDSLWEAAGLEVALRATSALSVTRVPTYTVKDSAQVVPFLKSQHGVLDDDDDDNDGSSSESDSDESLGEAILQGKKSRRTAKRRSRNVFLPARARLGNVLLIVQIQAQPSQLPLPTLSKGRIPQDNHPIRLALTVALKTCLRKLQTSNPALFLTSRELRVVERKVCFVPNVSRAVASILSKSTSKAAREALETVQEWGDEDADGNQDNTVLGDHQGPTSISGFTSIIQRRILKILDQPKKKPARRGGAKNEEERSSVSSTEAQNLLEESPVHLRPRKLLRSASNGEDDDESNNDSSIDEDSYEDLM